MHKQIFLERIENSHRIKKTTDSLFLTELQRGLLLELKGRGFLTASQWIEAEEKLSRRFRYIPEEQP